jgi:hypothetical protein
MRASHYYSVDKGRGNGVFAEKADGLGRAIRRYPTPWRSIWCVSFSWHSNTRLAYWQKYFYQSKLYLDPEVVEIRLGYSLQIVRRSSNKMHLGFEHQRSLEILLQQYLKSAMLALSSQHASPHLEIYPIVILGSLESRRGLVSTARLIHSLQDKSLFGLEMCKSSLARCVTWNVDRYQPKTLNLLYYNLLIYDSSVH